MPKKDAMTEHSLYAYLRRRSTEELEAVLNYCIQGNRDKIYGEAVPVIMEILSERMEAEEELRLKVESLNGTDEEWLHTDASV